MAPDMEFSHFKNHPIIKISSGYLHSWKQYGGQLAAICRETGSIPAGLAALEGSIW